MATKSPKKSNTDLPGTVSLGDKLRALREERNLTLKEMGELTGLSFTYLSEIERNTVCPSVETIKELASFFKVPVSMLVNSQKGSSLPAKLQYIRKLKNLSQKDLAAKAKVSPGLIAQLELGKVNASLKTLNRLAEVLNVSVCYLIMDQQDVEGIMAGISPTLRTMLQDPKVQAVIGSICTLEEEQLKLILNFINMVKNPTLE